MCVCVCVCVCVCACVFVCVRGMDYTDLKKNGQVDYLMQEMCIRPRIAVALAIRAGEGELVTRGYVEICPFPNHNAVFISCHDDFTLI